MGHWAGEEEEETSGKVEAEAEDAAEAARYTQEVRRANLPGGRGSSIGAEGGGDAHGRLPSEDQRVLAGGW